MKRAALGAGAQWHWWQASIVAALCRAAPVPVRAKGPSAPVLVHIVLTAVPLISCFSHSKLGFAVWVIQSVLTSQACSLCPLLLSRLTLTHQANTYLGCCVWLDSAVLEKIGGGPCGGNSDPDLSKFVLHSVAHPSTLTCPSSSSSSLPPPLTH